MNIGFVGSLIPYKTRRGWGVYSFECLRALLTAETSHRYYSFANIWERSRRAFLLPENEYPQLKNIVWKIPGRCLDFLLKKTPVMKPETIFGKKIDIVHIPFEMVLKPSRIPQVVTVHDVTFLRYPRYLNSSFVRVMTRNIRDIARHASLIIADSNNTKKELCEYMAIDERRVRVIYLGIDKRFHPPKNREAVERVLRKYGVTTPFILFVGAADPDKNLHRLAAAFGKVRKNHPEVSLVFAGKKSWGYDALMAELHSMKCSRNILLTGFVDSDDLPLLYAGASIFAMPSLHEGFGLPVLEAMACGTPVVTSTAASLPEVAGDVGICVDPYDEDALSGALEQLLENKEKRAMIIAKGLCRAADFTWDKHARHLVTLYREVANGIR
ncbi:MAG: glycosyltransferase family 4 protein [Chitinispirillaceae bacterium]|nr:glycosyltransferase family 4 protein [Chitinispirillaceae bacterium]